MIWTVEIDNILGVGRPLFEIGIKNWALKKEDALIAVKELNSLNIPILGGDVYKLIDGDLAPNYDNWYSDKDRGESREDFIARSFLTSKNYIESYESTTNDEIFFSIVPG